MKNTDTTPELVFHVGDPKTGTTSIQAALKNNIVSPETRTLVPWMQPNGNTNATSLATILASSETDIRKAQYGRVRNWLSRTEADIAVISSEFFSWSDPARLQQAISEYLPDYVDRVRVIAYVRPHASRFLAAYTERTKMGTFLDDFDRFFPLIKKQKGLYYLPRFEKWRQIFGDRFVLRPFVKSELLGEDVVNDFFAEVLGETSFTVAQAVQKNSAQSTRTLAGLRLFHKLIAPEGFDKGTRAFLARRIYDVFLPMGKVNGEKPVLDRSTVQALKNTYFDDARAIDRAFFQRPVLEESLEKSGRDAPEDPIDLTPTRHFDPTQIQRLGALSQNVVEQIKPDPQLWVVYFQRASGLTISLAKWQDRLAENQALLARIDADLAEVADILRG